MRSRRRFSSHPVEAQGTVHISFSPFSSASSAVHSEGLDVIPHSAPDRSSFRQSICNPSQDVAISDPWMHTCPRCPLGCQRRQSDSQLVTLPPIPLSLHELCEFLRRPKYEVTAQAVCSEKQPTKEVLKSAMACAQQTSSQSPQSGPVAQMDETTDIDFQRSRYSRCSTTSASDSASSDQRCLDCSCSHCAVALGAGEAWALSGVGPLASAGNSEHMKGNLDTTSHTVLNCPATRRRRLPSSWSTATGVCPPGIDNSNLPSAGLWTSSGVMPGSGKPPPLSRSLSSGNSPPCAFTPLLPTSSVIPGSQLFFHRRQHTVSASEVIPPTVTDCVTSERCDSAAASVSVATVNDWSAKASLVSLSPGSIPLWADAPNYAKPRTGFNYVSRESLLTLHALRKQRQQAICHTPHHYHHHKDGNGSVSTSAPVSSSAVHQTYACTPLPKLLEMDNARAEQLSGRDHSQSSQCDCCNIGNPTQAQQYTTEPVNVPCRDSPASRLGRSYVNMAPPPRRVGLRPIEEHQSTRSAHTQPVGRRFRSDTTAPLIESIDTGSCSATTLSSYINISDLSKTSLSANAAVSSAMTGSPISASNTSIALTVQQPYINLVPSITSNGATADRGPRPVPTCVHSQRPSCTGALVVSGHDIPITSSLSHQTTVVSSTATVNEIHLEVPRLHYAHLTLSTNPDWRRGSSAGQSSSALTRLGSPTVESTSHLHGVHSVPATIFSDPSGALCPTSRPTEEESSTSGLNYVTIDLVQTKALSELERELRFNSAATNLLPLQRQTNTSRGLLRSHRKRGQPNSSDTYTSTVTNEPQTGTQHTDRGASHSGMRTGRDSLSSLSRIRSYLTHHLHSSSAFRSFARPPPAPSQNTTNTTP
ncbi:hypothetical protein P879_07512 [Paragonimus westermani]|uniref:Uncharacterized protein n=1 Tax=Paragonimus westermani TaxID=34504 RepID=A0A8T0D0U9_9TREM|nr:hypothetical protein P879_07512 [Paragonimus westermani]